MLDEEGVVIEICNFQKAKVQVTRSSTCGECVSKKVCEAFGGSDQMQVVATNPVQAKVGDRVLLSLPNKAVLRASLIVYLIPLLTLLGGATIGQQISEAGAIIGAFLGLGASFLGLWYYNKHLKPELYTPSITRILNV